LYSHFRQHFVILFSIAVRSGDLQKFGETLGKHHAQFVRDGTLSLVVRLRQSVVRAAVRRISVAYSCISMSDVQRKLLLARPDEAKFILAKVGNICVFNDIL